LFSIFLFTHFKKSQFDPGNFLRTPPTASYHLAVKAHKAPEESYFCKNLIAIRCILKFWPFILWFGGWFSLPCFSLYTGVLKAG
jgi:hypothetical protein